MESELEGCGSGQSERVLEHMGDGLPPRACACGRPRLGVVEHEAESGVDFEGGPGRRVAGLVGGVQTHKPGGGIRRCALP